eukprot:372280-Rhodomonas_salina.1
MTAKAYSLPGLRPSNGMPGSIIIRRQHRAPRSTRTGWSGGWQQHTQGQYRAAPSARREIASGDLGGKGRRCRGRLKRPFGSRRKCAGTRRASHSRRLETTRRPFPLGNSTVRRPGSRRRCMLVPDMA